MRNCKKSSSNWILCPSKSIQGKLYYFNVVTGEAVWGLDDTDGSTMKKDNMIHKVINKSHVYPEPHNSPEVTQRKPPTIHTYSNTISSQQNVAKQCPSFGQAIFPQYFSNTPSIMPGVMWTPIQMPMFVKSEEKKMLDQDTQTSEFGDIIIQTCKMPLSKRFALLQCNKELEDSGNKITHSSPMCSDNWWNKGNLADNQFIQKEQQCKRKLDISTPIIKEPKLHFLMPHDTLSNKNIQQNLNNIENSQSEEMIKRDIKTIGNNMLKNLDKTDLRYLLISKRRKPFNCDVSGGDKKQEENKTLKKVQEKKKVTFNLKTNDDISDISKETNDNIIKTPISINVLRNLSEIQDLTTIWYIITDKDVLMENFNFITDYINQDDFCKLLVPKCVLSSIQSSGFGDSGLPHVLTARQIYRKIMNFTKVEIVSMEENMTLNDQIINCCLEAINEDKHIVLITKYSKLLERAKFFGIHAFYLNDIINYNFKDTFKSKTIETKNKEKKKTKIDYNPLVLTKNVKINENLKEKIDFSNDTPFNDRTLIDNEQDNEKSINYIEMSNINRNIQKLNINNSNEIKRVINKNDKKTFKPLVFQKIFSNNEEVDETGEELTDFQNGGDMNRSKQNGGLFEHFVLNTDNANNNRHTRIDNKNMENKEMRFHIKDESMKHNIVLRINEYICCYVQIMEEFINIVFEKNTFAKCFLPFFFHEGLECLKQFCLDVKIKTIIDKLLSLWKKEDKTKKDIAPNDFMQLLQYGWLLIDALKDSTPQAMKEINYSFTKLYENIENPVLEDIEIVQTPVRRGQDDIQRSNYIKTESEVLEYLKKHFVEWQHFEISNLNSDLTNKDNDHNIEVLRTSGKNLNLFKINNKKRITFNNCNENTQKNNSNTKIIQNEAKITRNVNLIEEFEERIKKTNLSLDLDLDFNTDSTFIINNEINDSSHNDGNLVIESVTDHYNDTADSGFEAETHTCSFLRNFLIYLSSTFRLIFSFIEKCRNDFQDGYVKEEDKKCIYEKATHTYKEMNEIIIKLKCIIERESKENSKLKCLLIKAGQDVSEDKRMMRYRQTVIKCLEQAQILNGCLKLILNTNKDNTDDISMNSYDIGYYNIFE